MRRARARGSGSITYACTRENILVPDMWCSYCCIKYRYERKQHTNPCIEIQCRQHNLHTWHDHRSFHARCCRASRSANSHRSPPSSFVTFTALAASLSCCSDDTLASISEIVLALSRLFNSSSAACARLFRRSCNTLFMHATEASRPPRRTRCRLRSPPLFRWCLHWSPLRKRLDFVARLPFLPVA